MKKCDPLSLNTAIKKTIRGTVFDRSRKLLPEVKEEIRQLYATGKWTYKTLATEYKVCASTIQITIHPEVMNRIKYGYTREQLTAINKSTRNYKLKLLKEGKI